jgi:transcriptional regulator with XRE-family HTH domain
MSEAPQASATPQWTLGDRLRKARETAGLSQAQLAREIGIGRTSLTHYETGKKAIPKTALLAWAFRTGVPFAWLADGETGPLNSGPGTPDQAGRQDSISWSVPRTLLHKRIHIVPYSPFPSLTPAVAA